MRLGDIGAPRASSHARGELGDRRAVPPSLDRRLRVRGRVVEDGPAVGRHATVITEVEGSAYRTGEHTFELDPRDPARDGFPAALTVCSSLDTPDARGPIAEDDARERFLHRHGRRRPSRSFILVTLLPRRCLGYDGELVGLVVVAVDLRPGQRRSSKPIVRLLALPITLMTLGLFGVRHQRRPAAADSRFIANLVGFGFTVGGFPPDSHRRRVRRRARRRDRHQHRRDDRRAGRPGLRLVA